MSDYRDPNEPMYGYEPADAHGNLNVAVAALRAGREPERTFGGININGRPVGSRRLSHLASTPRRPTRHRGDDGTCHHR